MTDLEDSLLRLASAFVQLQERKRQHKRRLIQLDRHLAAAPIRVYKDDTLDDEGKHDDITVGNQISPDDF